MVDVVDLFSMIDNQKNYTYSVHCKDVARVVEFSPYELSSKLLAIGASTQIIIASCRFPVSNEMN